jgi:hypothetical protein
MTEPTELEAYLMAVGIGVAQGHRVDELESEALGELLDLLNAEVLDRDMRHTGVLH